MSFGQTCYCLAHLSYHFHFSGKKTDLPFWGEDQSHQDKPWLMGKVTCLGFSHFFFPQIDEIHLWKLLLNSFQIVKLF